jgi:hypothetical protein
MREEMGAIHVEANSRVVVDLLLQPPTCYEPAARQTITSTKTQQMSGLSAKASKLLPL